MMTLAAGGPNGPTGDTYLYPHTQIDAQGSYAFSNGIQIVVSALNLNNQVFGFYMDARSSTSSASSTGARSSWGSGSTDNERKTHPAGAPPTDRQGCRPHAPRC